jgi:hypothetical protein
VSSESLPSLEELLYFGIASRRGVDMRPQSIGSWKLLVLVEVERFSF